MLCDDKYEYGSGKQARGCREYTGKSVVSRIVHARRVKEMYLGHRCEKEHGKKGTPECFLRSRFIKIFLEKIQSQNTSDSKDVATSDIKMKKNHLLDDE